ncbi:glycosyltransferase [Lysobacter sp. CA199]|uniref:glycosyltransferase n=1 Tax=Lysobacter sp. CA199 TaxID=3455608 RepID=UPI003F8D8843
MNADALNSFKNSHAGQSVIVCGCGQSLTSHSPQLGSISIGVNDVGRCFDPTYLVVLNPRSQFKHDRFRYVEHSNARALFTQIELGAVRPPVVRFRLGQYGGIGPQTDGALNYTQNSPYVAVCLAAYMGARRIGLIGVDFTDDHFFAATGRHPLTGRLREIDAQYGKLAAALRARGIELVNLSPISRLTQLPRAALDHDWIDPLCAQEREDAVAAARRFAAPHTSAAAPPRPSIPPAAPARSPLMKVAIEKRSGGMVGGLLDALARSIAGLGHSVSRDPRFTANNPRVLSIVWNGRGYTTQGPTLYCEHGWLPRSDYQISPCGINADSHAAPFVWNGQALTAEQDAALQRRLEAIKAAEFDGYYQYMQANRPESTALPAQFLLVPLQIESDTNIVRHAPAQLRGMQALIDHVSQLDPPWPVIYKQHPADARTVNRHLRLRLRRGQDLLWPQSRGNVHQMLRSGACRGILTLNSNVAHDGLLWDVPAIVLGRNVWPAQAPVQPFLTQVPQDWSLLQASVSAPESVACRRAYTWHLISHQFTLADAADPTRVSALLELALRERPLARAGSVIPRLVPRPPTRPVRVSAETAPTINVVAENKGWLFEHWKQALAAQSQPGYRIVASERPIAQARAWIFLRASEAGRSPEPMRSVVQLHDSGAPALYRRDGARADVARCAGLMLAHPDQRAVLEQAGIDLSQRRWTLQPVGWNPGVAQPASGAALPTLAWVGRPCTRGGLDTADASGLADFIAAARDLRGRARVVLVGERLDAAMRELSRAGVDCAYRTLAQCPLARVGEWIGRFDAVVVTGSTDCGPWPLFDAVRAGVPVIAARVGWAPQLLADEERGLLVDHADAMRAAIETVLDRRERWAQRRASLTPQCAEYGFDAWVRANLRLAAEASGDVRDGDARAVA